MLSNGQHPEAVVAVVAARGVRLGTSARRSCQIAQRTAGRITEWQRSRGTWTCLRTQTVSGREGDRIRKWTRLRLRTRHSPVRGFRLEDHMNFGTCKTHTSSLGPPPSGPDDKESVYSGGVIVCCPLLTPWGLENKRTGPLSVLVRSLHFDGDILYHQRIPRMHIGTTIPGQVSSTNRNER